ncbi:hypothetical protein Desgi_1124 [Desulfoscipio gibsoniae DSM 7213]|uniref:Uncharacterized protein n=1 Tax=Desulfoscipio gibsoniae DSM 7213 TaxID=767817 RepID=R4KDJ2_9FIRM|nr:hypothetical protein Desgi_1124 [Desulfoscipio gibsoniae DSM 7213]
MIGIVINQYKVWCSEKNYYNKWVEVPLNTEIS